MAKAREADEAAQGEARVAGAKSATEGDCEELVTSVLAAAWLLSGISSRSIESIDPRTTLTQFRTLMVLARGPINLSKLANELGVNVSTAMRSIDRLIGVGYATRGENPQSRREVVLCLSPEGQQLVVAANERRREEIARLLGALSAQLRAELIAGLDAFVAAGEQVGSGRGAPSALGW